MTDARAKQISDRMYLAAIKAIGRSDLDATSAYCIIAQYRLAGATDGGFPGGSDAELKGVVFGLVQAGRLAPVEGPAGVVTRYRLV